MGCRAEEPDPLDLREPRAFHGTQDQRQPMAAIIFDSEHRLFKFEHAERPAKELARPRENDSHIPVMGLASLSGCNTRNHAGISQRRPGG